MRQTQTMASFPTKHKETHILSKVTSNDELTLPSSSVSVYILFFLCFGAWDCNFISSDCCYNECAHESWVNPENNCEMNKNFLKTESQPKNVSILKIYHKLLADTRDW